MTMTDDLVTEARKGGPCAELGDRCRAIEAASGCFCAAVADRIEALTAERNQAWKMVAEADTRLGQALGDALQDKADNARLRKLLTEAAADLTAYVNAEYPPDTCAAYPHIAKRHHRDMELVRHIEAALNTGKEPGHD